MKNAFLPLLALALLGAALPARADGDSDAPAETETVSTFGDAEQPADPISGNKVVSPTSFVEIPFDQLKVIPLSAFKSGMLGQSISLDGKSDEATAQNPLGIVAGMSLLAGRVRSWGDSSTATLISPARTPDREPITRFEPIAPGGPPPPFTSPEPASLALLALGLVPLGYRLRTRSKKP